MPVSPAGTRPHRALDLSGGRSRTSVPPTFTRLRVAVTALFAFVGAVFGSWAARIPDVTEQVGATHATLGIALLCVSLGALASMQLTGLLAARCGSGRVVVGGVLGLCLVVPLPGLATTVPGLSAALLLFGVFTGLVNVAVNSAGVAVEARRPDRPLLPFLHAAFSLGGLAGAAAGGIASRSDRCSRTWSAWAWWGWGSRCGPGPCSPVSVERHRHPPERRSWITIAARRRAIGSTAHAPSTPHHPTTPRAPRSAAAGWSCCSG